MKLDKGKKALSKKGFRHNIEVMIKAGYPKKRAQGTAYGEAGMAKKKAGKCLKKNPNGKMS